MFQWKPEEKCFDEARSGYAIRIFVFAFWANDCFSGGAYSCLHSNLFYRQGQSACHSFSNVLVGSNLGINSILNLITGKAPGNGLKKDEVKQGIRYLFRVRITLKVIFFIFRLVADDDYIKALKPE